MRRRRLQLSLLLVVGTVLLLASSGCIRFDVRTKVNPDGSGTRSIETVLDPSLSDLAQLSGESSAAAFESQLRDAMPPNAKLNTFVRKGERHYVARFGFASLAELNRINRGESRRRGPQSPVASLRVGGNPFYATYDFAEYLPPLSEPLTAQERGMAERVHIDYSISLPGTIVSSNADSFPGPSSAKWQIDLMKGRRIQATSRSLNWPVIAGAIVGALCLVGAAVFAVTFLVRRGSKGPGAEVSKSQPADHSGT